MASILRVGLSTLGTSGLLGGLCKLAPKHCVPALSQIAMISTKDSRLTLAPKRPPLKYEDEYYYDFRLQLDPIEERFDDNTKVIVVDGLPGMGKAKLAKELADQLDMDYIEPDTFDKIYVHPHGFDYRSINHLLPETAQYFDMNTFLQNPTGINSAAMQITLFSIRVSQYIDVLRDVLATGRGAVVQRCPFSDFVFTTAMVKNNFMSRPAAKKYKEVQEGILQSLMRPHLIVYLDAPASVAMANIKKRNRPIEANSKALTEKYLQDVSDAYKKKYLPEMAEPCHILMYDWSTPGDPEMVIYDITRLEFDNIDFNDTKFPDWNVEDPKALRENRALYANHKSDILLNDDPNFSDVAELFLPADINMARDKVLATIEELKYDPEFHPLYVKDNVFFKTDEKPKLRKLR